MKCPKCGHENRDPKKFCVKCGSPLVRSCPRCGTPAEAEAVFCGECGASLSERGEGAGESSSLGERKQVTVMFADLSGYTAMSEKLDPEEVREVMNLLFGEVAQIVARYEGIIEKFIGDAVMAVFGVPVSHEDDPVRAVRAAMEIHAVAVRLSPKVENRIGKRLRMHTGINTGLVVTGKSLEGEGTHGVTGDTVNLAARLEDVAGEDEIVIGQSTAQQVSRFFELMEFPPVSLKGKAEPVVAFKVIGVRDRPAAVRLSHHRTPLIGREEEMAVLHEGLARLRKKQGTIISVVGELGMGKSRLIEEFRAGWRQEKFTWLEGYAHAFTQNVSYAPVIDLLSRAWQIKESDAVETVRAKLEANLKALLPEWETARGFLGRLFGILEPGLERISPEAWKNTFYDLVRDLLMTLANREPTIVLLEDLQWSDPATRDLLRFLLSPYEFTYPLLFLLTYRPGLQLFGLEGGKEKEERWREIHLQDLSSVESQALLFSLLGREIPPELPGFIRQKAGGNPFYLEEVVSSLLETGVLEAGGGRWKITRQLEVADLPSTLQGVIAARLDRLDREQKRLVQEAAVIGRTFSLPLLERISSAGSRLRQRLQALVQLDLIQPWGPAEENEFIFKHALTQEAAYNSLLIKERQELHEKIGRGLENLFAEDKEKYCELLASHFGRAREEEKEIVYSIMAGEKNQKANAVFAAIQYYSRANELLKARGEDLEKLKIRMLVLEKLWLNTLATDFKKCHQTVNELLEVYERLGNEEGLLLGKARLMWSLSSMGRVNDSQAIYREIAPRLPPGSLAAAAARLCLAETKRLQGDYRCLSEFLAVRPDLGKMNPAILAGDLVLSLGALAFSGQVKAAWQEFEQAMAFCDQHQLFAVKIGCLIHAIATCYFDGQYPLVPDLLLRIDQLTHRLGKTSGESIFPIYGGHMLCIMVFGDLGDLPAMEKNIGRLIESLDQAGFDPDQAKHLIGFCQGLLFAEKGELDLAISTLQAAVDGLHATMDCCFYLPHALNALGRVLFRAGKIEAARACHEEALAYAEPREDRPNLIYARRMLGLIQAAKGDFASSDHQLALALTDAENLALRPHMAWTLEAMATASFFRGQQETEKKDHWFTLSSERFQRALELWDQMANPYQKKKAEERRKEIINQVSATQ